MSVQVCSECTADSTFAREPETSSLLECGECRSEIEAVAAGARKPVGASRTGADDPPPPEVAATVDALNAAGLWFVISRNPPVRSCAEAASRRKRLGGVGIPLCDELKSAVVRLDGPGPARYVAFHTRGHRQLDLGKAATAAGSSFHRIDEAELRERFAMGYGTVTPFALARFPEIRQIFDAGVVERGFPPYTMMTNAGHLEYAVEFRPEEFLAAQPRTRVDDLVAGDRLSHPRGQTIGILTGNSPESGMLLWEKLNRRIRESSRIRFRGDVSFPRVLVESAPDMGMSMELAVRADEVRRTVLAAVERLCANGATVICIACNTTQYFESDITKICAENGVAYVSVVEETARFLRAEGIRRFDLLATAAVSDLDGWSEFRNLAEEFDIVLPSRRHREALMDLAFAVKREMVSSATLNKVRDLVNQSARTDTVLLALTELSILFASRQYRPKSSKRFIDTMDLVARRIAEMYEDDRAAHGMN